MQSTKLKIVQVSEQLFFELGIANVRLQQIADAADISVGNLAYHYNNKEAIVFAVYENLFTQLSNILSQFIVHQELDGFDKQFSALYHFYNENNFTYNNQWEIGRNYPEIQNEWLSTMNKIMLQFKKRLEFNVKSGYLKPELYKGAHDILAQNLSLLSHSILPQLLLRKKVVKESEYKKLLWSLLIPVFTEKGKTFFDRQVSQY